MNKDSKIYVAGHTGLLGSALLKRLKSEGYSNIVTRTHAELDLTRQEMVQEFFKNEQPEYVFLCAGQTGGIMANKTYPATFLHTNIAIQDNVFEAAQRHGVKHLIFYGSSCMYPKYSPQPIKEEYLLTGEIEETSEAYATAKIAGIIACKAYNNQFKTNRFIALIPNSMYGPNDNFDLENSHVLSALIRRFYEAKTEGRNRITLWGSGNPRREFMFCEDVAEASIFAMKNAARFENKHYNVGTSTDCTIKELADKIAAIVGYSGNISWNRTKPDGTAKKLLDSTNFSSMGWTPTTFLDKGLEMTYEYFLNSVI